MHTLLKSIYQNPIPIEKKNKLKDKINPTLSNKCRRHLKYMHISSFDWKFGGILSPIKFIDRDSVEYSLTAGSNGDINEKRMAKLTLDNAIALIDPVWGGTYQYSTLSKWDMPHYKKTIAAQAGHLRIYSLAYADMKLSNYLDIANSIQRYIYNFMISNNNTFYTSQSGKMPKINQIDFFSLKKSKQEEIMSSKIDKQILVRENGWVIEALATHAEYCGDKKSLFMAIKAIDFINKNYRSNDGGYLRNQSSSEPQYLSDTLAMARALLQIYRNTFDEKYLKYSSESLNFINKNFRSRFFGFYNKISIHADDSSICQIDENISLTRFANLMKYYTNENKFDDIIKHGLRYLSIPEVATARIEEAGVLLVDLETQTTPLTINIFGNKASTKTTEFLKIAHKKEGWYKLIKLHESKKDSVSIEIDGFKSKPVYSPDKLNELLLTH
ncbi:MAG: hypothetical protein ACJ0Q4_04690 [Gammaproteobacteria bacterium]